MLNVEFVKQFAGFGAILAGFSMAIAYSLLLHAQPANTAQSMPTERYTKLLQTAAGAFFVSAIVLVLAVFLAAWTLSIFNLIPEGQPTPDGLIHSADWVFYLTLGGGLALLVGVAISGFIRSKPLGFVTATLSSLALVAAAIAYFMLTPPGG